MQIQIKADRNVEGRQALVAEASEIVEKALSRFSAHITQVEVHLSDQASHKNSHNDKRCMMEARLEGRQPIAVSHEAETLDQAIVGASDKLAKLIESTLERRRDQRRHRTDPSLPGSKPPGE
jgi:ribosome-associated translation inhibitor RaiA